MQLLFTSMRVSNIVCVRVRIHYGLFTLADPDLDPYSDSDSYIMQKFHIGSDSGLDPLIEMYVVGTEILSLKWVQ